LPSANESVILDNTTLPGTPNQRFRLGVLLLVAAWFGILAGLVEGGGLLFFQALDWRSWGIVTHVTSSILWISPVLDVTFFGSITLVLGLLARRKPKLQNFRILIFLLTALTLYDWLLILHRLTHLASLLLACGIATVLSKWLAARQALAVRFWSRTLPVLCAALAVIFIAVAGGSWWREKRALADLPASVPGSPNVLVVVIDTLRADHLSAYGYPRTTTPTIDRLAHEGVLFENAVSASSWTFPSHVSLLTGQYLFENGLGKIPRLRVWPSRDQTIPVPMIGEDLERRGYRTAAFSANRVCFDQTLGFGRGFQRFEDFDFSTYDALSRTILGREFGRLLLSRGLVRRVVARLGWQYDADLEGTAATWKTHVLDSRPQRKRGDEINRELLTWIDSGPRSHPFFAFLNYFDVHEFYGGPPSFSRPWPDDKPLDLYDSGINYVDGCIARLMAELAHRRLDHNTLVIITADHGEMFGEHGLENHGKSLYWDLIHVPLIFWYPGRIPAGVRVPRTVSTTSLPTTLSTWLPGPTNFRFPGHSLAQFFDSSNASSPTSDPAIAELAFNSYEFDLKTIPRYSFPSDLEGSMKSVVSGHWHLIAHKSLGNQLYNVASDPHENNDLINTPQGRDIAGTLSGQLLDVLSHRTSRTGRENIGPLGTDKNIPLPYPRQTSARSQLNGLFTVRANGASTVQLEMQPSESSQALSPIFAVEDAFGKVLGSCRNPEHDRPSASRASVPAPGASDSLCLNISVDESAHNSLRLQLLVPGSPGVPVDLFLRAADWDGKKIAASYRILGNEPSESTSLAAEAGNKRSSMTFALASHE